ncbi:MAG: succinyldiaminopimelate transaminase [Ectothiorhodospira sp.]
MNPDLDRLQPYPFQRLAALKAGITPPRGLTHIPLSIGEPRHPAPAMAVQALQGALGGLSRYPVTRGEDALREAVADWAIQRFGLPENALDPHRHVLPVNGTREALFALAQCVVDRTRPDPRVLMPNPFYQIYEGAALLAGARPVFMDLMADRGFLPDPDAVDPQTWEHGQLLYLCNPGNPSGAVMDEASLVRLLELAHRHDFVIAADECYSEIHPRDGTPPPGMLGAAHRAGLPGFERVLVFHSLSKRSNLPGLRSGFVAGDARLVEAFHRYRTYHGCAMAPPAQAASIAAWRDEAHVAENQALYDRKFRAVLEVLDGVLDLQRPAAGFYLWAPVPGGEDTAFARDLFAHEHITVLPGSYLSRDTPGGNPGRGRVRLALVPPLEDCIEAAQRIRRFLQAGA